MQLCLYVLVLALHFASHRQQATEHPDAGFRLVLPDVGWTQREERVDESLRALYVGPATLGGLVELKIEVEIVVGADERTARGAVQQLRAAAEGSEGISELAPFELELTGRIAPGLELVRTAEDVELRVRTLALCSRSMLYRIQFHAPRADFDEHWATARSVLAGFRLIALDEAATERVQLTQLAALCGSQIDWILDWDAVSERARRERKLVVVGIHALPGFEIGDQRMLFTDPDLVALMRQRFVGLLWFPGQAAPFADEAVFGLSERTFGSGLLVCSPEGRVLRQVYLLEPLLVADVLRDTLREHAELAPTPPCARTARAEQAEFWLDCGALDAARDALGEPASDEPLAVALQRARLRRIERRGHLALAALERARAAVGAESAAALEVESARVLLGLGRNADAERALRRGLAEPLADPLRAEMLWTLGLIAWADGDLESARELWRSLASTLFLEPRAWAAAGMLTDPTLKIGRRPDLRWPSTADVRMASLPPPAPVATTLELAQARAAAEEWLIALQRPDGGWDTPSGVGDTELARDPIAMATQAIAVHALIDASSARRDGDPVRAARCSAAARAGLSRYLADRALAREHPRPVAFMDYTCWGSSYGLFCLRAALDETREGIDGLLDEERAALRGEAAHLVGDLVRAQQANGGWSYYLSGSVDGEAVVIAMSFATATVLLALEDARALGTEVQDDVLERGYACLARMRGPNGLFEYSRQGTSRHAAGRVAPTDGAARGPVCTLALVRGGILGADAMAPVFELYAEHLDGFGAQARKALMHAGADGQGSHYLLYDYSTAARALRAVGPDELDAALRRRVRAAILRELARCRSADGSFVDNPLIGSVAGTGLALLAMLDIERDPHGE